ncbi:MAG: lysylphosphatidylglycerol synthase transmembrane domain-containing protein, partial [Verrucomicrobia bacterium]|nr:lysylphosphatidylglycerol synthase transmembrane domain-containing protein [Verrucomicrobiota bacterium]
MKPAAWRRYRQVALYALKLGITLVLFYFILSPLDQVRLWTILGGLDFLSIALALSILGLQTLVTSIRWKHILQPLGARLSFVSIFRLLLIGAYFNQGLPSAIGGDAVRVLYVQRAGLSLSHAMTSVVLDRLAAMMWLLIMTAAGFPILLDLADGSQRAWSIGFLTLMGLAAFGVLA